MNFSVALKKASPSFGPLYCSLAAAGEASGALDEILKRQAHYLKTLAELQSRLILAMIYPAFLILAGIGVSIVFVTTLIPQLTLPGPNTGHIMVLAQIAQIPVQLLHALFVRLHTFTL